MTPWRASQPISIADVAYCAVAAGFGSTVAVVVTELERRLSELLAASDRQH
jgi:hypothetical protein